MKHFIKQIEFSLAKDVSFKYSFPLGDHAAIISLKNTFWNSMSENEVLQTGLNTSYRDISLYLFLRIK